jgi:hypothetical protein
MGTFGLGGLHRKSTWLYPVATFASLPPTAVDGSVAVVTGTNIPYQYDASLPGWIPLTGGSGGGTGGGSITLGFRGIIPASASFQALSVNSGVSSTSAGFTPTAASTLIGMSFTVDDAHPTNVYTLEAIRDPTGLQGTGPVIWGGGTATLVLPATTRVATRRDLSISMPAGAEVGAFVRRTSGSGASTPIKSIIVILEYTTP